MCSPERMQWEVEGVGVMISGNKTFVGDSCAR